MELQAGQQMAERTGLEAYDGNGQGEWLCSRFQTILTRGYRTNK